MVGGGYFRLMRFEKPIGIFLLWFPLAIALWLANQGQPPLHLMIYFLLGTVVMRAAGCVVNDLADRHIDRHVQRTQKRPLVTGEVTFGGSIILLVILLMLALWIVIQLPIGCFYLACLGLFVTILYPFCKRWFQAPQFILGIAFSVAIPMVYTASSVQYNDIMLFQVIINLLWVIEYDTMYAMVDRADDLRLGVKSTAVLFGTYDCWIIAILQLTIHGLWFLIGHMLYMNVWFYGAWFLGACILIYQQILIKNRDPICCFKAFKSNALYGLLIWAGVIGNYH